MIDLGWENFNVVLLDNSSLLIPSSRSREIFIKVSIFLDWVFLEKSDFKSQHEFIIDFEMGLGKYFLWGRRMQAFITFFFNVSKVFFFGDEILPSTNKKTQRKKVNFLMFYSRSMKIHNKLYVLLPKKSSFLLFIFTPSSS